MIIDFKEIYDHVLVILKNRLPGHTYYHSVDHTLYVLDRVEYIANKENVNQHGLFLLKIAALYHDIGFVFSGENHEEVSCKIVRADLRQFGFAKEDIEAICGMIMATKVPQKPQNLLEQVLADADLEYLGTKHFKRISEKLYQEMKHGDPALTRDKWNLIQIEFMSKHSYHTDFCKQYKTDIKNKNIDMLKNN